MYHLDLRRPEIFTVQKVKTTRPSGGWVGGFFAGPNSCLIGAHLFRGNLGSSMV